MYITTINIKNNKYSLQVSSKEQKHPCIPRHILRHNLRVNVTSLCFTYKNIFPCQTLVLLTTSSVAPVLSCRLSPGQNDQPEFPEALQSRPPHQAAAAGLHHPHPSVDLRSVLQGDNALGRLNAHTGSRAWENNGV